MKHQENNNNNNTGNQMLPNKTSSLISKGMNVIYTAMKGLNFNPIQSEITYSIVCANHRTYEPSFEDFEHGLLEETLELALEDLQANYPNNEYWRRIEFLVFDARFECMGTLLVELCEKYEPIQMRFDVGNNKNEMDHFNIGGILKCV